jgi:hypothetical protein
MSDRDEINSRPKRASEAHRKSRKIERKADMEAFEREHQEYMKKLQDEIYQIEKDSQAYEILHQARMDKTEKDRRESEKDRRKREKDRQE